MPRICPRLVSVFRRRTVLVTPEVHWSSPKISFKKRPLNGKIKISLRKDSYRYWFTYNSCQVSRKSVKRKWPNGCVVFITKGLIFCFFVSPIILFPFLVPLPIFVQIRSVFDEIYPKSLPDSLQYRRAIACYPCRSIVCFLSIVMFIRHKAAKDRQEDRYIHTDNIKAPK